MVFRDPVGLPAYVDACGPCLRWGRDEPNSVFCVTCGRPRRREIPPGVPVLVSLHTPGGNSSQGRSVRVVFFVDTIETAGLGNRSYLAGGARTAVAVDPPRDID